MLHTLFDIYAIDEVHVFTAPKDAGGDAPAAPRLRKQPLKDVVTTDLDGDEYLRAAWDLDGGSVLAYTTTFRRGQRLRFS